jgi:hypothetical protein
MGFQHPTDGYRVGLALYRFIRLHDVKKLASAREEGWLMIRVTHGDNGFTAVFKKDKV